jgi:hypothetical protein
MNIVRRCVTGQRQRRRTGPHGSRANPALSDPRVSPNWRIRHRFAITRGIPPRFMRTYKAAVAL